LSGNQCVQAVLKLGPDSVSGNTIVQSAANTLMYISGDKVNIGTSSFATGTKLYLYDVASGPIIALSGLDSNYRGLTIKNTNDAEQWFIGNNASNNFVIRANSSNDILIVNASTSNVGIGTTTPGAKLDVNGSLAVRGSISFTGPSYIGASSRLLMVDNEGNVSATTTLAGVSMPTGATGQTLRYGASAWEATSTIYIKDGKVGIKTNTPTEALSVEGNVYINTGESSNTFVVHNNPEQNNQIRVDGDAGNVILSESFGNVGIGAPAPDAKLDVNGSLAVRGSVSFTGPLYTGTGSRLLMVDSSGNVSATSTLSGVSMPSGTTGQTLRYGASGWEATSTIYIKDGKVGIGTTNPGVSLEINQNTGAIITPLLRLTYSNTVGAGGSIDFYTSTSANWGRIESAADISNYGSMRFYTAKNGVLTEALRIKGDGNVGIGTTTPAAKLDVNGSLAVRSAVSFTGPSYTGSNRLLMVDSAGNVSATSTLSGISMPSGTTGQTLRYGASAWEATSTIYIKNDGNVGIGTTNPRSKLEVNGNIYVSPAVSYAGSDIFGVQKEQRSIVTVPAAGWYKVAHIDSSNGRGQNTVTIHTTGGSYTPVSVTMRWFHDWGTSAGISVISEMGNTSYWSQARVTDDGVNSFLEVYFTRAISNLYLSLQYDGGFSAGSLYSGDLVAGGGDVRASTPLGLFALSDKFVVNSSGNVGIGTTSPSASLAVNGNAIANPPTASGHLATKGYVDSAMQSLWVNSGNYLYASSTIWNVGIGTTTPDAKLDVNGNLAVRGSVSFTDVTLYAGSGSRYLMVDNGGGVFATTTAGGGGNYVLKGGDIMSGTLHFETSTVNVAIDAHDNSITGVRKLSVVVIDPLYDIGGVKYSSYAPSMVGGVKEEYVGRGNIKDCGSEFCSWVLDFSQVSEGSDLWVWRQIIDFRPETIEVLMTAYGQPALLSYEIGDNQIKFYSDRPTQFSYRLVGSRFDWRRWPTLAPDQSESTSLIIK